jgi:hypothetical protein
MSCRLTGKIAPSTATVPERDVKRILPVLNPVVPENFGYSGAYQVWPVEPSFLVRKRRFVFRGQILQIANPGEKISPEITAERLQIVTPLF